MKKLLLAIIFTTLIATGLAKAQSNVIATPNPVKFTQPNGDKITFRLYGDANMNYMLTVDGYIIEWGNNEALYYVKYNKCKDTYIPKKMVSNKPAPKFAIKLNENYLSKKRLLRREGIM